MHQFNCPICSKTHPLITLIEFPVPQVIGDITSGVLDKNLEFWSKHIFFINRELIIFQCELSLPIKAYGDT